MVSLRIYLLLNSAYTFLFYVYVMSKNLTLLLFRRLSSHLCYRERITKKNKKNYNTQSKKNYSYLNKLLVSSSLFLEILFR